MCSGPGFSFPPRRRATSWTGFTRNLHKAMQVPAVQERLAKVGTETMAMSADEFGKYFRDDVLSTAKLMQQVGVKPRD